MSRLVFIFTRAATPVSVLVRAVDGGDWSHVAVLDVDGAHVIEAVHTDGVRRRRLDTLLAVRPDRLVLCLEVPDAIAGLAWGRSRVGRLYDYGALLSIAIRRLFGVAPRFDAKGRDFCSELAAGMCARALRPVVDGGEGRVGVRDFHRALLAAGAVVTALSGHA